MSGGSPMADNGEDRIENAARRLERAVVLLEQRLSRLSGEAEAGGLFDQDRAKLAAEQASEVVRAEPDSRRQGW